MRLMRSSKGTFWQLLSRITLGGFVGMLILCVAIVFALFADVLSPHDPNQKAITNKLRPPIGSEAAI